MSILYYLAVGRLVKESGQFVTGRHEIIASATHHTVLTQEPDYYNHAQKLMDNGASRLNAGSRLRLTADGVGNALAQIPDSNSNKGVKNYDLHVLPDSISLPGESSENMIVFFAVTSNKFGQVQNVPRLFEEFKAGFLSVNRVNDIVKAKNKGSVHTNTLPLMNKLFNTFGVDKLAAVQAKVGEVKSVMQQNVTAALKNMDDLTELEGKSEQFENQAANFKKSATNVKKMMRCRNIKMTLMLVFIVVVIITIIVLANVPLGSSSASSEDAPP